jgi:ABC-type polysaccharide/polyol phosphate export permease
LVQTQSDKLGGLFGSSITVMSIYRLNPLERFVAIFRNLLYDNRWPDPSDYLYITFCALVSLALGVLIFRRSEKGLAEAL